MMLVKINSCKGFIVSLIMTEENLTAPEFIKEIKYLFLRFTTVIDSL